jgi:hypothetical protein
MRWLLPELPPGLEIKVEGASCFRWCGVITMVALVLAQLLIELDIVGGENGQEPPAVLFGSVGGDHAHATPTAPDAAWCRAARGQAADQRHACTVIAHQAIPEGVALKQQSNHVEQDDVRASTISTPHDTSPPWATRESLLATLRAGIRRFDLDVFATYNSEAGHSLLIAHPGQVQSALGLARPPTQHTAIEIAAMAEHKLWPSPLTLDELLAWMGTTGAGQLVEGITLEPKRDESIPESAFVKMLDNVVRAPGLDSRTTIILRSVGLHIITPSWQWQSLSSPFSFASAIETMQILNCSPTAKLVLCVVAMCRKRRSLQPLSGCSITISIQQPQTPGTFRPSLALL